MRNFVLAVSLLSILSGCTSTRIVAPHSRRPQLDSLDYSEVQKRIEDRKVKVSLRGGYISSDVNAHVAPDSTRLFMQSAGPVRVVSTHTVLRVETADHFGGALVGFFAGTFGGGFLGWVYGSSTSHGDMRGLGVGLATIGGAFVGAIGGLIVGGIHGYVVVYGFNKESGESHGAEKSEKSPP